MSHKPDMSQMPAEVTRFFGSIRRIFFLACIALSLGIIVAYYTVAGLFLFIITLLMFMGMLSLLRKARRITDTPTARIRSASQGYVKLKGQLSSEDNSSPIAPLSNTPCHYWKIHAQQYKKVRSSKRGSGREWLTVAKASSAEYFIPMKDDTGTCFVMIQAAEIYGNSYIAKYNNAQDFASWKNLFPADKQSTLQGSGDWRLVETCLPAKSPLFATGLFSTIRSSKSPFEVDWINKARSQKDSTSNSLAQWAADLYAPVQEAADDLWFREMRRLEGIGQDAPLQGSLQVHTLTSNLRPGYDSPLILSSDGEQALAKRYRLQALGRFIASMAALLVLAVLIHYQIDPQGASTFYPLLFQSISALTGR